MESLLKKFFEKELEHGFVKRLKKYLHADFNVTMKDFTPFLARELKGKKPDFDPLHMVPSIIKEVGAVQIESIKLYTQFLCEEAEKSIEASKSA